MKMLLLAVVVSMLLVSCKENTAPTPKSSPTEKTAPTSAAPADKSPTGDAAAGKAVAERECKACHGMDGRGVAPAIPHLAAQRERYLLASMNEYKDGKRTHAALRDIATHMS